MKCETCEIHLVFTNDYDELMCKGCGAQEECCDCLDFKFTDEEHEVVVQALKEWRDRLAAEAGEFKREREVY